MRYVDHSALPVIGACYGYGGLELGVRRAVPLRTVAYVEREAYACANVVAAIEAGAMDAAPIHTDVVSFPWRLFRGKVAGILAGYPCQPESLAGAGAGKADARWLWPYLRAGVDAVRPAWCFFENVAGHVARGLGDVLDDLGRLGYRTTAGIFSAAEVGAPHLRRRIFIFAADADGMWKRQLGGVITQERERIGDRVTPSDAANADGERLQERNWSIGTPGPRAHFNRCAWWTTESPLCGSDDAPAARVDRLRLLGNGVVPAQAELAFRSLALELANAE